MIVCEDSILGPEYNQTEIEIELNKLGANFEKFTDDEIIEKIKRRK